MSSKKTKARPPSARHQRAVAAVQELFRIAPVEAAGWVFSKRRATRKYPALHVHEAQFIEQAPRGPKYVVPKPQADQPETKEDALKRLLGDALARDAKASGGEWSVVPLQLDLGEVQRQALAEGGCEVELLARATRGNGKPLPMLLGVALPRDDDDGSEMHWHVLQKTSWHMVAFEKLVSSQTPSAKPSFDCMPLYLWPGTGLQDPQENCSVFTHATPQVPGRVGALLKQAQQQAQERAHHRRLNKERLVYTRRLDRERRAAAARRKELMGDAGISDEELAALVPAVDVECDFISMWLPYDSVRLWEMPVEALLEELPPECVGLSLFGYRPAEVEPRDVLQRCGFVLRQRLHGAEPGRLDRAAAALAAMAEAHLEPDEVRRTLATMKLVR